MRQVARRAPREHYPAPYAIIELWARFGARGAAAFEAEARSIAHLFTTETARNLVRVFLLQDRLKGPARQERCRDPATCTSSAPASWAATSRPGVRCAASR